MSNEFSEKKLLDAGNELLSPPSSVDELLSALDLLENMLAEVEQSPSVSMKEALGPSTKALIAENLLRHSNVDVKVAVASCISEITRITAPDAPYEDDQMKEVFQLIVSTFEKLDDKSSRSYMKRISILETLAKVRSCVVMLDLECDALIVEMFRHFFKSIRDDLHENVFLSMETIMILVVDESEEISQDLLSAILDVLKKENKEVLPIARQLGGTVIAKCASKLKPHLLHAVRSSGGSFDDYTKAVADVCRDGSEANEVTNGDSASKNLVDANELAHTPAENAVEVGMETLKDAPCSEEAGAVGSPKAVVSNGTLKENEDTSAGNNNSKDAGQDTQGGDAEPSSATVDTEGATKSQTKPGRSNRRKGRKPHSTKSSEPSEHIVLDRKQEAGKTLEHQENDVKDVDNVQNDEPVADATVPAENEIVSEAPICPSKTSANVPSPTPAEGVADEAHSEKVGREKVDSAQDGGPAKVDSKKKSGNKKALDKNSGSKNKLSNRTSKKSTCASDGAKIGPGSADVKKEADSADESNGESEEDVKGETEVEGKQLEEKKKRGQATATPGKAQAKTSLKDERTKTVAKDDGDVEASKSTSKRKRTSNEKKIVAKDESDVEDASKSNSKRKRTSTEKVPKTKRYGADLVGSMVKVWWPDDDEFYKGVVESFDSIKKMHKILYDDGDVEVLNLKDERWELVNPSLPDEMSGGESPDGSADETLKVKKTKASADQGAKHGKTVTSSKKSGASSSKSKATPKAGSKQEDGKKFSKLEESSSKSGAEKGGKSTSKSGNKSSVDAPKSVKKSKDNDADTLKSSSKSKQDTSKSAAKSKSKSPKSGGKADPIPMEESEDESQSHDEERTPEKSKEKSQSTPKSQKNSKKRKRSVKA